MGQTSRDRSALIRGRRNLLAVAFTLVVAVACFGEPPMDRAATENQQQAGMKERGRDPGSYSVTTSQGKGGTNPSLFSSPLREWRYTLQYSEVLLSPGGKHLLAMAPLPGPDKGWDEPGLTLVVHDLDTGDARVVPEVRDARRINFAPDGSAAYALGEDGRTLLSVDLGTARAKTLRVLDEPYRVLDVSPGGRYLVASNLPKTDAEEWFFDNDSCVQLASRSSRDQESACVLTIIDLETRLARQVTHDLPVRDLDFSPAHDELVLTSSFWPWDSEAPIATLTFVSLPGGELRERVEFPNCADELVVQPEGTLALLSPTNCRSAARPPQPASPKTEPDEPKEKEPKAPPPPPRRDYDPISVLDLASRTFIRNLPGFGPVEMSDDGRRAVGFTRRADMLQAWDYNQTADVGLIVVHLPSLHWRVIEYGRVEPTYYLGPRGRWLYAAEFDLDCSRTSPECGFYPDAARVFDLDEVLPQRTVSGHRFDFSHFSATDEGRTLYSLSDAGLVKLRLGDAETELIPLSVAPELVSGEQDRLVLGEDDAPVFYLFDAASEEEPERLDLGAAVGR